MSDFMASVGRKYSISYETTNIDDFELLRYMCRYFDKEKAIPVEWIKRWISERNDFPTMPYNQHILNMIEDWEKDNEAD